MISLLQAKRSNKYQHFVIGCIPRATQIENLARQAFVRGFTLNTINNLAQGKVKSSILSEEKCKIAHKNDLSLSIPLCQKCPEVTNSNRIIINILVHTNT